MSRIHRLNYLLYFSFHYLFDKKFRNLRRLIIKGPVDSINYIIKNRVSVSRFGDGEFSLMIGQDTDFQRYNVSIGKKLQEILISDSPDLVVCLPYPWKHLWILKWQAFEYWSSYLTNNLEGKILRYINMNKTYLDASFTRFYIDYKNSKNAQRLVPLIKKIWEDRDVCIVEGEFTRMGIGNDLLDNARSVHRIIAPSLNAFDKYDAIIAAVKTNTPRTSLLLLALGMTATCLAYDLSKDGYQAVDIGHVDVEYEWYLVKAQEKIPINNKYVAESKERLVNDGSVDTLYREQIIARVL